MGKVKVPVLIKMGDQVEGPVRMTVEEGPALFDKRTRDMYAIRNPPTVFERNGRRRIGYVVSREAAQTLVFNAESGTFEPANDPDFKWAPWVRSAQTVRAHNAQGEAADWPLWMKIGLAFAGLAIGVLAVGLINMFSGGFLF